VAAEFITEDSAWQNGNGKCTEFDRKCADMVNRARLGHYSVVLVWAIDRLSPQGHPRHAGNAHGALRHRRRCLVPPGAVARHV